MKTSELSCPECGSFQVEVLENEILFCICEECKYHDSLENFTYEVN